MRIHLFRDAARAREIVTVLLRYRFDEILRKIDTPVAWLGRITPRDKGNLTLWQRVRLAIEELGPTFVKAAQLLSTRPDILPRDLIEELKELRDQVKPEPFEVMKPVLETILGGPIDQTFAEFEETPLASGSLGQVYRARLRLTGQRVAVKVQRPDIRKPITTDLEIMAWFAEQLDQHFSRLQPFDLPTVVEELRQGIMDELDFTIEARNIQLFNSLNHSPERVFAPTVLTEYTEPHLLVTEWIDGVSPDEAVLDPAVARQLARDGGDSFFSQISVSGFFHGDPHGGNIFVTPGQQLCFIDWGLAGQLTRAMRHHLIELFSACQDADAERVTRVGMRMGQSARRIDRIQLEKAVTSTLFKHSDSLRTMRNLGHLVFDLIFVFGSHGIHLTRDYTLLARAIISIEEAAKQLDPDFNLAEVGEPYVRRISLSRWNLLRQARFLASDGREKLATLSEIPGDLQRLIHRVEDEDIHLQLRHNNLEPATDTIHSAFSRLSLSVIIGSLIIGSSLVVTTGVEPYIWGYPAIGLIGYLLSAVAGIVFIWDVWHGSRQARRSWRDQDVRFKKQVMKKQGMRPPP